jgi:hypothetical protein
MLWNGTAQSAVDLTPTNITGYGYSIALDTDGVHQVGFGYGSATGSSHHALLWGGSADSAVDLNGLLPGSFTSSESYSIDAAGNIFGIGVGTYNDVYRGYAVEWSPVPEPSSLAWVGSSIGILFRRPRRPGFLS